MASTWGASWGSAWGDSWGAIVSAPAVRTPQPAIPSATNVFTPSLDFIAQVPTAEHLWKEQRIKKALAKIEKRKRQPRRKMHDEDELLLLG